MPRSTTTTGARPSVVSSFREALRQQQYMYSTTAGGTIEYSEDNPFEVPVPRDEQPLEEMKKRHLNGSERRTFHKPRPDWIMTGKGEVLRSASALDVEDLIAMIA